MVSLIDIAPLPLWSNGGIDVLLGSDEWNAGLRSDALAGLTATPKTLTPTWLYDDSGSALYDAITRLPEYYPSRTEQSILDRSLS